MSTSHPAGTQQSPPASAAVRALAAAGDTESAGDVSALDGAAAGAQLRLARTRKGLVERLIYGPTPAPAELESGAQIGRGGEAEDPVVRAALECLTHGKAFTADQKLSTELRTAVAAAKGYGFTVPVEFGGRGKGYGDLALVEEGLAAHGLGALAVEISGELTIGAGSLLAYGTQAQRRTFLPMIAQGRLIAFALTEVRIGVNAKKVRAYVEPDPAGQGHRLFATGDRNKLWITNATHGGLAGVVARIGKDGKAVGLFVVELPDRDVAAGDGADYTFTLTPSGADAFQPNFNARIAFDNFPIPQRNRIEADGVEVLFYCLRMGRCMLAAMSAGYQRMFAADTANYARQRDGVGGPVIKHELPRLSLARMLGGALQARALSHLSLQQDADGVDLAGLRDLTKSAASATAMESLLACERVLGGRSFDKNARVNAARANVHVFGVVEGEDDLILMGMVRDVTSTFTDRYLAGLLGVIQAINLGEDGKPLPKDQLILRIDAKTLRRYPTRCLRATFNLLGQGGFWRLAGWIAGNAALDVARLPLRLIPTALLPRYRSLPRELRGLARYAERELRASRWIYLGVNLWFQLELTRAQIPLQRFGKRLEHLTSMVALCFHASQQDATQQRVAALQCTLLREKVKGIRLLSGLLALEQTRRLVDAVGRDLEANASSLVTDIPPEPFAHPWEPDAGRRLK